MTRRTLIAAAVSVTALRSDDRDDALEAISPLATALADGDAEAFIRRVAEDAPGYAQLAVNIRGLVAMAEITSSILVPEAESGAARLDWEMRIRSRATRMFIEERRREVRIRFEKRKLLAIEPVSFFAPPKA
jgi:hypothetical protein